jgi:transposase
MNIRYRVELSEAERLELEGLLIGGKHAARKVKRAQILLAADAGVSDETIANTVRVSGSTVYRTQRRFVEGNLELALAEEPRPGATRKLSGKETALLVATACSDPPRGRKRWTLELLADAMVKLTEHESLSRDTVRRRLAEDDLKPWRREMWCIAHVDGAYVARMEDVLDLYAEDPDPKRPVVCFDESPTQLIGETRLPIPPAPGQPERYDCEYKRNGTANVFVFVDAHKSWRHVKVTDHRAARDFAHCMRDLADTHYPEADRIRVVMDMCGRPRRCKKNLFEEHGAWSGADMCPASAAACHMPPARMGVRGAGPIQSRALKARIHDLVFPIPSR